MKSKSLVDLLDSMLSAVLKFRVFLRSLVDFRKPCLKVLAMALPSGQPINGRDVEQLTSAWSPERFAALCDALAWAASGRACPFPPSFTARVNVKDDGIDAEWAVEIPEDGSSIPTPILGSGWNVFQYKKRDLIAQDRRRVIATLKSSISGAVDKLVKKEKRVPNRYVLFVNVDLTHRDKLALKEAILKNSSRQEHQNSHVEIVGAAELAALLNNFPHLRAAYFEDRSFKAWMAAYEDHRERKRFSTNADLVGREEDLKRVQALVDDPQVRVIVVTGAHAVGKSRLVLEATRHRPHDVVVALDPRSMDARDYRHLSGDHGEVACIVEDPEPDSVRSLIDEALTTPHCKLLLTLPTQSSATEPSYGRDDRVQTHRLGPLSEEHARALLHAVGRPLAYEIEDWILRHAGGVPGIILAAASVDLRRDRTSFVEAVGSEFERRIEKELGAETLSCARLLSLMTHVGFRGGKEGDLRLLCELFGEGLSVHGAVLLVDHLARVGVVKVGGTFAQVTIPLLANYMATQALRGRPQDEILALFGRLTELGRVRFLERLSEVKSEEVTQLWEAMFASDGPFGDFRQALAQAHMLRFVVGAVPERILSVLEDGLLDMTREERLAIVGEQRRELMWTLEQLLFRRKTSVGAIRLLWLLAEAENETWSNNATGVLAECFHPLHPQMPLPLWERLALLRKLLSEGVSLQGKLLAIKIVERAASASGSGVWLRQEHGSEPFDARPLTTTGEIVNYCQSLLDLLMALARTSDEAGTAALQTLPSLVAEFGIIVDHRGAVEHFQTLADWTRSGKSSLGVAAVVGSLRHLKSMLASSLEAPDFPKDRREEYRSSVVRAEYLLSMLEGASFALRLQRWAGPWAYESFDEPQEDSPPRFEEELMKLADEAVRTPDFLDTRLLNWLFSAEAERAVTFFYCLGKSDRGRIFWKAIEEIGKQPEKAQLFAAYWSGWAGKESDRAEQRLDELAAAHGVSGPAIVQATLAAPPSARSVERVERQFLEGRVDASSVGSAFFAGRWVKQLTEEQYERVLRLLAGEKFESAEVAVVTMRMGLPLDRPLQGRLADFAWCCLENSFPTEKSLESWAFDFLAAHLAKNDPQRGFVFLHSLLSKPARNFSRWDFVDRPGSEQFWKILFAYDRRRLIEALLDAARSEGFYGFRLVRRARALVDQEHDSEVLISCARSDAVNARTIADWLSGAKPGFWPLALQFVQLYPHDEAILGNLTASLMRQGDDSWGSFAEFYEERKREIKRVLGESSTPPEARSWLREVLSRLEREIPRQMVWEYDVDVDALRSDIRDKESPQRLWAIGRVLKYARFEDLRRLLTVEDIEEALPQVDLPKKRRKMLETALPVWRYA